MAEPGGDRDPARARFLAIALIRISGAAMIMLGLLALNGALDWGATVGGALVVLGIFDFAVVPILLSRRWRSPPQ